MTRVIDRAIYLLAWVVMQCLDSLIQRVSIGYDVWGEFPSAPGLLLTRAQRQNQVSLWPFDTEIRVQFSDDSNGHPIGYFPRPITTCAELRAGVIVDFPILKEFGEQFNDRFVGTTHRETLITDWTGAPPLHKVPFDPYVPLSVNKARKICQHLRSFHSTIIEWGNVYSKVVFLCGLV